MSQLIITLSDSSKGKILQEFLKTLDYIQSVEPVNTEINASNNNILGENQLLYVPKHSYTVADMEAIVRQFPDDHSWTYSDLCQYFPQNLKIRIEIINKQIFIMPSPTELHQEIVGDLFIAMKAFAKKHKLGKIIISPFDVVLDENNVVVPDIVFVSIKNQSILDGKRAKGSPDLLIEVWSPGNTKDERERKRGLYEEKGVQEFWAIFPQEKKVSIEFLNTETHTYELISEAQEQGSVRSRVLEGFTLDISEIFG